MENRNMENNFENVDFEKLEATQYVIEELGYDNEVRFQLEKVDNINFDMIYKTTKYYVKSVRYESNAIIISFEKSKNDRKFSLTDL